MDKLFQKNHGLPGIGINGKAGEKGEKGHSVYFGYINDFFDGAEIQLGSYVYVAKRISDHYNKWQGKANTLNKILSYTDSSVLMEGMLDPDNYNYYYTGILYDYNLDYTKSSSDASILQKLTTYKIDFTNDAQLMSVMIASADRKVTFHYDYSQSTFPYYLNGEGTGFNNDIEYVEVTDGGNTYKFNQLYNYTPTGSTAKLKDDGHVQILYEDKMPYITYDSNDAAYMSCININNPDFLTNWLFDTGKFDYRNKEYENINKQLDDKLEQVNNLSYDIDVIAENINTPVVLGNYILGTETNLYEASFASDIKKGNLYRYQTKNIMLLCGQQSVFNFDPNQYFKTSLISSRPLKADDICDNAGYAYYGIADSKLFTKNIQLGDKNIIPKELNDNAFSDKLYPFLAKELAEYSKNIKKYQAFTTRNHVYSDDGYIQYITHDEVDSIIIPTTLNSSYKTGDILYFYLDEKDKKKDNNIDYMVVLTENMLKCTKNQLIKYAQVAKPFNIHHLDSIGKRVINTTGIAVTKADISTDYDKYITKSVTSIIDTQTDAGIIIANNDIDSSIMEITAVTTLDDQYKLQTFADSSYLNISASESIKFENAYINKNNEINAELYASLYDSNIILEGDFIRPIEYIQSYKDNSGNPYIGTTLHASDYFYNTDDLTGYVYGYDLMDENMAVMQHRYTSMQTLDMFVPVYTNTKTLYIMLWASTANGIKHYSRLMYIDIECQKILVSQQIVSVPVFNISSMLKQKIQSLKKLQKTYEYLVSKCDIYVQGNDKLFTRKKMNGNIEYELKSTLTSEKNTNIKLNVLMKNDDYILHSVKFDLNDISSNETINANGWSSINCIDISTYTLSVSSNIPGCDTLQQYVVTKDIEIDGDSKLFQDIVDGIQPDKTNNRSILMTAGYTEKMKPYVFYDSSNYFETYKKYPYNVTVYDTQKKDITNNVYVYYKDFDTNSIIIKINESDDPSLNTSYYMVYTTVGGDMNIVFDNVIHNYISVDSSMTFPEPNVYYENMYITQPGFTDTRDVPDISLTMHNSMIDIQSYNTLENNVLCNQLITYLDININDFSDKWGQFINADTSIKMSFDVKNIISDIDWQHDNIVTDGIYRHATIKLCPENKLNDSTQNNNYVLLYPSLVKTDTDLIYLNNNVTEYKSEKCCIDTSICLYNTITDNPHNVSTYKISDRQYILVNKDVIENNAHPQNIYEGIEEIITLKFTDIDINDFNDGTLHLKLLYEFGNPMISNLYLRFAVDNINIKVSNKGKVTTFTAKVPKIVSENPIDKRLFKFNSNTDYEYTYISEPLNVMTNPLSYTVCPTIKETTITNMSGSLYKEGSNAQIQHLLQFFNTSIYENKTLMDTNNEDLRKYCQMSWSGLKLKKSYFQDNIQNIQVKAVNNISNIDGYNLYKMLCVCEDTSIDTYSDVLSKISDTYNYMGIVYNGGIMSPRQRDGIYNFYYNGTTYDLARYSQYGNEMPVFANDDIKIDLRDDSLFDAIQIWNKEYVASEQYQSDITFTGNISLFGNGYTQLLNTIDTGQYGDNILSLSETKKQNDIYIYKYEACNDVYKDIISNNEPENGGYFRTFLYDLNMEYNMPISDTEIRPYQIVSEFDVFLDYQHVIKQSIEDYTVKIEELRKKNKYFIPYTQLYDVYPRVCYNIDKKNINMLMLRMPTIQYDTDLYDETNYIYNLNTHYFDVMPGQSIDKIHGNYKK